MNSTGFTRLQIRWGIGLLAVLYFMSVAINLGAMELDGEEPRRAIVSLEMMQSGQYFNPTQFGWPYYNKPAVFNWILIGFIRLFGSASETVLRLPSLLLYMLWAALHYRFSKIYLPASSALLSALMLLTSADIYFYGLANGAEIDVFYSFVVYLQVIAFFHYFQLQQWMKLFASSYLLCAVGFLTKGFPSLVFEGCTLLALCVFARSVRPLFRWEHLVGIMVFAGLTGAYCWAYSIQGNVQHLLVNFLNESLAKSAIGERSNKVFEKAVGYPLLLLKLVAPWSLLLLLLCIKKVRRTVAENSLVRFSILFIACNIWVYWLTGQPKARYVYMFAPFATLVFVQLLFSWLPTSARRFDRILKWFGVVFVAAAGGVFLFAFYQATLMVPAIVAFLLLALFSWQYYFLQTGTRLWAFAAGIIVLRLVYAMVFVPFQAQTTAYYRAPMTEAAKSFGNGPLTFYAPPQPFEISLNTSLFAWKADTLFMPKAFPSQVPYYYYLQTGQLMRYDTVQTRGGNFVSYAADLQEQPIDTVLQFGQKREPNTLVLYRLGAH